MGAGASEAADEQTCQVFGFHAVGLTEGLLSLSPRVCRSAGLKQSACIVVPGRVGDGGPSHRPHFTFAWISL